MHISKYLLFVVDSLNMLQYILNICYIVCGQKFLIM